MYIIVSTEIFTKNKLRIKLYIFVLVFLLNYITSHDLLITVLNILCRFILWFLHYSYL